MMMVVLKRDFSWLGLRERQGSKDGVLYYQIWDGWELQLPWYEITHILKIIFQHVYYLVLAMF